MSPRHLGMTLEREVALLKQATSALEVALGQARRADQESGMQLAATKKRIVTATHASVPASDDSAIPKRINEAVAAAFTATTTALRQHWEMVCRILSDALRRVAAGLANKKRQLEAERARRRH